MRATLLVGCVSLWMWVSAAALTTSAGVAGCNVTPAIPSPPSSAVVFKPSSAADQTNDLQNALNKLHTGDWLVISPGTYSISKHLAITINGVTLYGKGVTLHSTSPTDGGLLIRADDVSVYNFTLTQDSTSRQSTPWSGGIAVFDDRTGQPRRVSGSIIRGNTINNAAAVGIFLYKATRFTVADNTIYRSWADGIHMTGGTSTGRVIHNQVSQTGDDMVGIVSYAGNPKVTGLAARYAQMSLDNLDQNIYVAENQLSDQYWGRGISVVGGSDVTIENNTISKVPTAAGIYLVRETAYLTFGDHDIVVRNNNISEIQTSPPTYAPPSAKLVLSQHGAIEVSSQMDSDESSDPTYRNLLGVSGIQISGNSVQNSRFSGIRLGANSNVNNTVSNVSVQSQTLGNVGTPSVAALAGGMNQGSLACSQNKVDGTVWAAHCAKGDTSSVTMKAASADNPTTTGATLSCRADGSIAASGPNPPSSVTVQ